VDIPIWSHIMDFQIMQKKKKFRTPIIFEIHLWIILLFMIDSIFIMAWEIYGSKVVEFAVYRDAIVRIVILTPSYLSSHQEYWIDYGYQNYSEWNFGWDKSSDIVLCMICKSTLCHQGGAKKWGNLIFF